MRVSFSVMKKNILVFVLLSLGLIGSVAQQSSENLLRLLQSKQLISAKEADSLLKVEKSVVPAKTFFQSPKLKLAGYGHVGYQYSDTSSLNNTYGVKCVFLVLDGKISKTVGFMIQSNLGPTPTLYEYYGEWTPATYFKVKVGQMKIPFSLENLMSRSAVENITGSQTVNNLVGGSTDVIGAQCGGGRDVGLQFAGSVLPYQKRYLIDYQVGVFNGNGINNLDNNNQKDVVGWLTFYPKANLKINTSIYCGQTLYKSKELADVTAKNHIRNRWSVGAEWDTRYLLSRAEYIHGKDGSIDKGGAYLMLIGHLPYNIDLLGEVDTFNKDLQLNNRKFTNYQLGVNWNFSKRSRLQLHYVRKDNNFAKIENAVLGQMQLFF